MTQTGSEHPVTSSVPADPSAPWADFAPPLRAFLARRVPAGVDADDLLQEVSVRVIRHLNTLRATERPEAWLFQIARNALRDSLRARQRSDGRTDPLEIDLSDDSDAASLRASEVELAPCLTSMIGRLSEPYRSAIQLTSIRGLTQADAAREAGVSISGMKSRVKRGREQLRQMLVRCCEIEVDVRGGVADFHLRFPGACEAPSGANRTERVGADANLRPTRSRFAARENRGAVPSRIWNRSVEHRPQLNLRYRVLA